MSQQLQDPNTATEQSQVTPPSSYESALLSPPDTISPNLAHLPSIDRLLNLLICLLFLNLSFVLYFFVWFLVSLFHGWNYCSSTLFFVHSSMLSIPCPYFWKPLSYRWFRFSTFACLKKSIKRSFDFCAAAYPTWNYLYSCLTRNQRFNPFTCVHETHKLNETLAFLSTCRMSIWLFLLFLFSMDPDDQAPNVASQQFSSMSCVATVMPSYSCLLPGLFDGTTDFEDIVTQFNSAASFSDWQNHPTNDLRPHFFSARFSADASSFYRLLTRPQQTNMNGVLHFFRSQYDPNQDALEPKVKALRQQPGQTTLTIFSRVARFSPHNLSSRGCPKWDLADHFYCRFV